MKSEEGIGVSPGIRVTGGDKYAKEQFSNHWE
jgi:hypothetical protein